MTLPLPLPVALPGQSNMAIPLSYTLNATAAIADAKHFPNIRRLTLSGYNASGTTVLPDPVSTTTGTWEVASPGSVPTWSAVCYLSAVAMLRAHCDGSSSIRSTGTGNGTGPNQLGDVCDSSKALPVGLIQVAVGATPMENWMSQCNVIITPLATT